MMNRWFWGGRSGGYANDGAPMGPLLIVSLTYKKSQGLVVSFTFQFSIGVYCKVIVWRCLTIPVIWREKKINKWSWCWSMIDQIHLLPKTYIKKHHSSRNHEEEKSICEDAHPQASYHQACNRKKILWIYILNRTGSIVSTFEGPRTNRQT